MKRTFYYGFLMSLVALLASTAMAVTDEEIQKITQAMPPKAVVKPAAARTVLVFSLCNGYKHSSIPYWQKALDIMSQKTGAFTVVHSTDMAIFTEESLKPFDAICFNNTTGLTPDASQQKAIMDFITSGKSIIGIHAATDNFNNWPEGMMMMGGVFKGHPWGAGGTWAMKIDEPQHPLMQSFEGKGFKISDEIYRTLPPQYSRTSQRVLMSLDMSDAATKNADGVTPEDMDTGISWIKPVGKGRLFYCSLGHNHPLTWTTPVLAHYLAGIQYALGDLKVDDAPVSGAWTLDGDKVTALTNQIKGYDWPQSRASLAQFEQMVIDQANSPASLKMLEAKLIEALGSECTVAAKDFFCRQLSVIGTDDAVETLAKMLTDASTFDMARFALDRIGGDKAAGALLNALRTAKQPNQKVGLLTSLGARKSDAAVDDIAAMIKDPNPLLADAAINALAAIGTEKAMQSLQSTAGGSSSKKSIQTAMLRCADTLNGDGHTASARKIYESLYSGQADTLTKSAALVGLAQTAEPKLNEYVMASLNGDEPALRKTAMKVISQHVDKELLETAAASIEKMDAASQIQLITALSQNPLKIGAKAGEALAHHSEKDVRMAAYQALAVLGNQGSVLLLSRAAAAATDRDERQAAQDALYALGDGQTDRTILDAIVQQDIEEPVKTQLIQAAVERQSRDAVNVLLQTAQLADPKIAAQSVRALQSLAGPDDVESLVALMIKQPAASTENALTAAAMKIPDSTRRADILLKSYAKVEQPQAKASLLKVMGKLGDTNSVDLIKQEYASSDAVIREGAFRAMADWPGSEFTSTMKELAQSPDLKTKVLAFRSYVRMLGTDAQLLMEAYAMAQRPEEQLIVIGALANTGNEESLAFLEQISSDPQLATEAQMSQISICEKLAGSAAKPILTKLAQDGSTDAVKKRAADLLSKMK